MECFWGVEVKPGQTFTCESLRNNVINLTQVALGETTFLKDNEKVSVYLHVDKKIVLGTLINGRCHQIGLNLIFDKSFQISHSSKYASLFFCGYSRIVPKWKQSVRRDDNSDDEEEDKDSEDFHSSDDGNEKDEDDDDDDDKDEGTPKDLDAETPRIVKKGNVCTSEDDSNDEEGEYDEDENMEDSRSDDKDEESEDEVDSSEDEDEEISTFAMMRGSNHKRPRPNSGIKSPKTNKKPKVVTPQVEKPGKGKKYVQFSTDYDGASKSAKKGKNNPGGSKQQSLASKKDPKIRWYTLARKEGSFCCQASQRILSSESIRSSHDVRRHGRK